MSFEQFLWNIYRLTYEQYEELSLFQQQAVEIDFEERYGRKLKNKHYGGYKR